MFPILMTILMVRKNLLRNNYVISKSKLLYLSFYFLDELMLTEVTSIDKAGFQKDAF